MIFRQKFITIYIENNNLYKNIIGIIHSENKYCQNKELYKNCKIYKGDITNINFLKKIYRDNKIEYVIHCAAMKYIDTCEMFISDCININILSNWIFILFK